MAIIVLVCLVIIASIGTQLLRVALTGRARGRVEERTLQAEWLVESGVERAAYQLASNPNYQGETWEISAEELGNKHAGRVSIRVEVSKSHPKQRRLEVRADYPCDAADRSRLSKVLTWESVESKPDTDGGR